MTTKQTTLERLLGRVTSDPSGCLLWPGARDGSGYAQAHVAGRKRPVHRVIYEAFVGPIPDGLELDHVRARGCLNRHCVNPAHLEPVTHRENSLRGGGPVAANAARSKCERGHALSGDNVLIRANGTRMCRACRRITNRRHYEANRVQIMARRRERYASDPTRERQRMREYRERGTAS